MVFYLLLLFDRCIDDFHYLLLCVPLLYKKNNQLFEEKMILNIRPRKMMILRFFFVKKIMPLLYKKNLPIEGKVAQNFLMMPQI